MFNVSMRISALVAVKSCRCEEDRCQRDVNFFIKGLECKFFFLQPDPRQQGPICKKIIYILNFFIKFILQIGCTSRLLAAKVSAPSSLASITLDLDIRVTSLEKRVYF